jgi:phosphoadenosine phosphosulfate reductase
VDFEASARIGGDAEATAQSLDAPLQAAELLPPAAGALLSALAARLEHRDAPAILDAAIHSLFPGRIALTSSFGADSVVLLHMVAQIAPATPVLFLDTGKLFAETIAYRNLLVERLGLRDVRSVAPDAARIADEDPSGYLWTVEPDRCCAVRKVEPLARALQEFDAWITGRKRFQGATRTQLPVFERDQDKVKINPLAGWAPDAISNYMEKHNLPRHPLVASGYTSIGCAVCTSPVKAGEAPRAGRWRNRGKTECGIHNGPRAAK